MGNSEINKVADPFKWDESDIRIFCEGKRGREHDRVELGAWRKSVNHHRGGGWVSVDSPEDISYAGTGPGPFQRRNHRSIEMQEIDRGSKFERLNGHRWDLRLRIWCPTCGVSRTWKQAKAFWDVLDRADTVLVDPSTRELSLLEFTRARMYTGW